MISHSINSPTNYDIGMLSQNFGILLHENYIVIMWKRKEISKLRDIAKWNKIQNFPFIVLQHLIDCISIGIGQ